ncbi:hypothetical protein DQ239_00300 [Blastococcus sp. TF02-09]|nr:hypothetical protein DQ239_00300 [Blastococcus sp. TF02-9]
MPAALVAVALAVVVVYAYYNDPWRPLAHVLGPWVALAVAVAFGRPPMVAIGASVTSLAAGVVTFFIGLKVGHDIRWGDSASVISTGATSSCGWCSPPSQVSVLD